MDLLPFLGGWASGLRGSRKLGKIWRMYFEGAEGRIGGLAGGLARLTHSPIRPKHVDEAPGVQHLAR
jgi:hypothetical protein